MKRKLIIFGNSSFAEMVAYYFEEQANYTVVAFTAHERFITTPQINLRPVIPFESISKEFKASEHDFFVALEHGRQNVARAEVIEEARTLGYQLTSFISPLAHLSSRAQVGAHCLILEKTILQYGVVIGANSIIGANSFFGQSCQVGQHNFFGNSFFADRHSIIGSYSIFGSHVRIAEAITIHDWANIQSFETVKDSMSVPTIIHPILRNPGYIIDKRPNKI